MAGVQFDLFGAPPAKAGDGKVVLELECHEEREKAFLLSRTGVRKHAKWVPKAMCVRLDDRPKSYELPRATALEKGFL